MLKMHRYKLVFVTYVALELILYCSFIQSEMQKNQIEKLLKLSKKLRTNTYGSGQCVSKKTVKKIIKNLSNNSINKRKRAYITIKKVLHCKIVKTYIEKHFTKMKPTAKYLIYNAMIEAKVPLNLPFINSSRYTKYQDFSTRALESSKKHLNEINEILYKYRYSKASVFDYLDTCMKDNQNQIIGINNRGKLINDYSYVECNRIFQLKDHTETNELLDLLFVCLYNSIKNSKDKLYSINKHKIFKKKLLTLFKKSIADIAIIYFSRYSDITKDIDKHEKSNKYNPRSHLNVTEKFLYIQGVLLYFFSHILNKGELLNNILDTISNNDIILTTFLSFPIVKSKHTQLYINTIINKLNTQRIQNNAYLLKGFLCIYNYFSNTCKNFNTINFKVVNPISDYNKVVDVIKRCLK